MRSVLPAVAVCLVLAFGLLGGAAEPVEPREASDLVNHSSFWMHAITACAVVGCVLLHLWALVLLSALMKRVNWRATFRMLVLMIGLLFAHFIEIELFGIAHLIIHHHLALGDLVGSVDGSVRDFVYFSAVTYTTLGFGDIVPVGDLRYLTAFESLTGMMMVGWSVSFTFLSMTRYWPGK